MGLRASILVYCDRTPLDLTKPAANWEVECRQLVSQLYPRTRFAEPFQISLLDGFFPDKDVINVGVFEGGAVLATRRAHLYNPTKLERRFLKSGGTVHLVTQRAFYDMFAYGRWHGETLIRSISVNPVGRIWESIGTPEPFETPFWDIADPAPSDDQLPFDPLEMAAAALAAVVGVQGEGQIVDGLVEPEDVSMMSFVKLRAST